MCDPVNEPKSKEFVTDPECDKHFEIYGTCDGCTYYLAELDGCSMDKDNGADISD